MGGPNSVRADEDCFLFRGTDLMKAEKNWLGRLLSPSHDRRGAERRGAPSLVAYYWDGAAPTAHPISDISGNGFYLLTQDRWYPGTMVTMTLQRVDEAGSRPAERSLSVQAKVIRSGVDGVGFGF